MHTEIWAIKSENTNFNRTCAAYTADLEKGDCFYCCKSDSHRYVRS